MMELKEWTDLIYFDPKIKIRANPSRHQEYIVSVLELVEEAREKPSDEVKDKLMSIEYQCCDGKSDHVRYARYLQHCLNVLKHEGKME